MILFGASPVRLLRKAASEYRNRPRTIRWLADEAKGKHKDNFITRQIRSAARTLEETGRAGQVDFYQSVSIVTAVLGFIVGLFTGNEFLPVILAVLGYLVPNLYVTFTAGSYWTKLNATLHDGLKMINASFRQNSVFVQAVRKNMDNLTNPLKSTMERFDYEYTFAGYRSREAIQRMKDRIRHPVFRQWCDAAIRCLDDPSRHDELNCIEALVEDNEIKERLDANIQNSIMMTALFIIMAALIVPFLYISFPELGEALLSSIPGKIVVALLAILVFNGLLTIVRVSRPVKLKEGDE